MTARVHAHTHVLLWWLSDPEKLLPPAREAIADGDSAVHFSAAGAWEMAIKRTLGRIEFPGNLAEILHTDHIAVLPITLEHALAVSDLPLHHTDPFDRMMISQARSEGLTIITKDAAIEEYDVSTIRI